MVIQGHSETPIEVSVIKSPHMESKRFVIVKNHIRELTTENEDLDNEENLPKRVRKSLKKTSKAHTSDTEIKSHKDVSEISASDLEELRSVYKQCKAVIKKIETKYGHLLNLNDTKPARKYNSKEKGYVEECSCGLNKKIVFDDDGQQIEKDTTLDCHVCPKKLKRRNSTTYNANSDRNVNVQYEETVKTLPDDIPSLVNILRNPEISVTYRNEVVNKARIVKQELLNELRFNKPSFKEKLKSNPEEVFEFAGANLFSLPGYPDWK